MPELPYSDRMFGMRGAVGDFEIRTHWMFGQGCVDVTHAFFT